MEPICSLKKDLITFQMKTKPLLDETLWFYQCKCISCLADLKFPIGKMMGKISKIGTKVLKNWQNK